MKTIIKLAIAAAVIYAAFQSGRAAVNYYEFKDATEQLLTFGTQMTVAQLQQRIVDKAVEQELPVRIENVHVRRQSVLTVASASYTKPIEFLPLFTYPVEFSFTVQAYSLNSGPEGTR